MDCPYCSSAHPCAAQISIFQHLDVDSQREISDLAAHLTMKKGDMLFSPDKNEGLYLISEGKVKVYELTPSGKEYLIRVLNKGDFVGEEALFGEEEIYTYGEALTDLRVCFIRRDDFMNLLIRFPSISLKLLEEFNRRMRHVSHQATANMCETVKERLAGYLVNLSEAQDSETVVLALSLRELSSYLNTTPETLSRRLAELQKKGAIERHGRQIRLLRRDELI